MPSLLQRSVAGFQGLPLEATSGAAGGGSSARAGDEARARPRRRKRMGSILDEAVLGEVVDEREGGLVDGHLARTQHQLGGERLLVRGGDSGEFGDLAGAGLLVEALRVPAFAGLDRGADVALDEGAGGGDGARAVAIAAVGRDE